MVRGLKHEEGETAGCALGKKREKPYEGKKGDRCAPTGTNDREKRRKGKKTDKKPKTTTMGTTYK